MTRPPRYRFPDEVRDVTRETAARMVREGTVATTPGELEAWLEQAPEVRASLERGGYGTAFDATDLFPLLQAMMGRQRGPAPTPDRTSSSSSGRWVVAGFVLVAIVVVVLIALGVDVLP